ncbi:MAG: NADH-quinone oxidoreductase subunit NuoE [Pantoea sp. Brub]|nr:NADH-quinone oxidoreductase subunit NuoE [Pantoea sp. Brub]
MYIKKIVVTKKHTKESFVLSQAECNAIKYEKKYYENTRALSIEALKIVQNNRGWISNDAIIAISKILQIPASDLEGIATFYSQIFRQPVGRYIIRYCDSVVCYINGYEDIKLFIENHLNIKPGQTTHDNKFTLLPVCCLGNCDKGPVIMINDKTYTNLKQEFIATILEQYK